MIQFSIVVPTLNEAENIDLLLTQILEQNLPPNSFEIIIVDDGSTDGTPDKVRLWKRDDIRLIERQEKPDLIGSVITGAVAARSEIIVVMDADLSHSPEYLPALVAPVLKGTHDIAIGSRYIAGGGIENWPLHRQLLSRAANWIASPICDVNDATSGFFAFRRKLASSIPNQAHGYKILLELLMANHGKTRITEIPICFRDRIRGSSKLSLSHQQAYAQRLITLAGGTVTFGTASRFAAVGLLGVLIDVAVFQWLISTGATLALAHFTGFLTAATSNYALNSKWAFREHHAGFLRWQQFARFLIVALLALLLRGGILALLVYAGDIPPLLAIFPAILATAVINYLGSAFYVFPNGNNQSHPDIRWRTAAIGIVAYMLLLRLIYFGLAQLVPDEAYYWQYAQHMDLSFYDHPPMVAWLIWLGTATLGNNEFGVRIGAFACGLISMGYLYALAKNLYDKSTAMCTILLLVILPFGFATGLAMLPDTPLLAAWAATLFYMERALVANQRTAWIGMGIAFGLGMLSKYTLGLLGIAALVFVIVDPVARRWLKRPHPYLAALLALTIFSPVIAWNFNHQWASFAFQSERVLADGSYDFAAHYLIAHITVLLTPVGLIAAILALLPDKQKTDTSQPEYRCRLFIQVFTGIPFLICLLLSTFDQPRFHWTSPIWLAILPAMAWMILNTNHFNGITRRIAKAWQYTILICVFTYAFVLHYVVLGIPGIPYQLLAEHYFWREAAMEVRQIAEQVRAESGKDPIIVGMSKWSVASALAFYTHDAANAGFEVRSRNLFGGSGSMYEFWNTDTDAIDRPIIQVGMKWRHIETIEIESQQNHSNSNNQKIKVATKQMLDHPGEIESRTIERYGIPVRKIYYRVSDGYTGTASICNLYPTTDPCTK